MRQANKGAGGMISTGVKPSPATNRSKATVSPKRNTTGN